MGKCVTGCVCARHEGRNAGPRRALTEDHKRKLSEAAKRQDHSYKIGRKQSAETVSKRTEKNKVACLGRTHNGRPARGSYIMSTGYRALTGQVHPLARSGEVLEHRKVLYDKIGPGPHPCHWIKVSGCGNTALEWGGLRGVIADHLDGDIVNNHPDNLVPSCCGCNSHRGSHVKGWKSVRV